MRTKAAFIGEKSSLFTGHTDEQPSIGSLLQSDTYFSLMAALQSVDSFFKIPVQDITKIIFHFLYRTNNQIKRTLVNVLINNYLLEKQLLNIV